MAIIKMRPPKAGKVGGLKAIMQYILNPEKTDGGLLTDAKDCVLENAYYDMLLTKKAFGKADGRQYIHIIQSFSIHDDIDGKTAQEIGKTLLDQFIGFQGVVATHIDCDHIHNHIVLNSVNWLDGHKWQQSKTDLQNLKDFSDAMCMGYGLSVIQKDDQRPVVYSKADLAKCVARSAKYAVSKAEFAENLESFGIAVDFIEDELVFSLENGKTIKNTDLMAFGDYSTYNIELMIYYNYTLLKDGWQDADCLLQACRDVSELFSQDDDYMANKIRNGLPMPKLEGQALKDYIIKMKNASGMKWEKFNGNQDYRYNKDIFLRTIENAVLIYEKEIQDQRMRQAYEEEYEDDWELY